MCAKWAIPVPPPKIEDPLNPNIKSNNKIPGPKYLAFTGMGKNINHKPALGNINAKATNTPSSAPESPTAAELYEDDNVSTTLTKYLTPLPFCIKLSISN